MFKVHYNSTDLVLDELKYITILRKPKGLLYIFAFLTPSYILLQLYNFGNDWRGIRNESMEVFH